MNTEAQKLLIQEISSLDEIFEEQMEIIEKIKVSIKKSQKTKDDKIINKDKISQSKISRNHISFNSEKHKHKTEFT